MTTTLTITSGQASFTAQNYTILPSPGTAVPDNLVNAILQAAQTAGVVLSSSAGVGAVTVASRRFNRSGVGAPQAGEGRWLLGDEVVDSAGSEWENTAPGDPGTWVAAQSGTSVPTVGSYTYDGQSRVTAEPDGTTYTYDDANGGRVATVSKGGTTRTAQYDTSSNLTGWV